MKLFVIRHGETALNAARVVQPANTPLGERGIQQAGLLSRRVAELGVSRVLTSDLPRARMTAEPIVATTGAPVDESPLLHERSFGDLRGTPYSELDDDIFAPDYVPPGGESWEAFDSRVAEAWSWIRGRMGDTDGNLAVVTHGLVCRSLLRQFFELGARGSPEHFGNTSLTIVGSKPPFAVELVNCVAHLDASASDDSPAPAEV